MSKHKCALCREYIENSVLMEHCEKKHDIVDIEVKCHFCSEWVSVTAMIDHLLKHPEEFKESLQKVGMEKEIIYETRYLSKKGEAVYS